MLWFYLAIVAYALNAIAFIIDKHLLSTPIIRPISYAFWVGILSLAVVVLLPFGIYWVSFYYFLISFASGAAFFLALVFLYKAIKKSDTSVASTKVGVLGVIFTYIFSILILKDYFSGQDVVALGFMVTGILFLGKAGKGIWREAIISGIAFGISTVLLKFTFNNSSFLNGFFWTRIGLVGVSLIALINPIVRKEILHSFKESSSFSRLIFFVNKIIAGIGFALLYVAIKLGNVFMVNALLSIQFVFIFILAVIFRNKISGISENIREVIVLEKLVGMIFVGIGLFMFFR